MLSSCLGTPSDLRQLGNHCRNEKAGRAWQKIGAYVLLTVTWMRHPAHVLLFAMGRRFQKTVAQSTSSSTQPPSDRLVAVNRMLKPELTEEARRWGMDPTGANVRELKAAIKIARDQGAAIPKQDPALRGLTRLLKDDVVKIMMSKNLNPTARRKIR